MKPVRIEEKDNMNIPLHQLEKLYNDVGWSAYTKDPDKLKKAVDQSLYQRSVWNGNELIGLIRAVGDNASILYVQDILVKKAYHGQGIGSRLLEHVLSKYSHIRQIVLMTENTEKTIGFYEKNGMQNVSVTGGLCFVKINANE